jgi:proteasome alpha subunit
MTPYDWQQSIAQRAQFAESRLVGGIPVAAVSRPEGILAVTLTPGPRKIFEIYDRLMLAAIGLQSDIEAVRTLSIDFCHQEGFHRSGDDVTIQRLSSTVSSSMKHQFGDLQSVPLAVRCLLAEAGDTPEHDRFVVVDPDGDYSECSCAACASPVPPTEKEQKILDKARSAKTTEKACEIIEGVLREAAKNREGETLEVEAALLRREAVAGRCFARLDDQRIGSI